MAYGTRTRTISNSDDLIDSRDIIRRIEELEGDRAALVADVDDLGNEGDDEYDEIAKEAAELALTEWDEGDDAEELKALKALADEAEGYCDWLHGATLIRGTYFEDYARQLAEDIGAIQQDMKWPCNHIDWEAAADELLIDYTTVEFSGEAYHVR